MKEGWFIEIRDLQFEDDAAGKLPPGARSCVEPWLPGGVGVLATLHNYAPGADSFDYIIITESLVYFAILFSGGDGCGLRSVKAFRMDSFMAMAHMMAPCPAEDVKDFPHVRIMLWDGGRIKLVLKELDGAGERRLQQLAQSTFFRQKG